ncbi:MAG TPA: trypsin-like peptidase domain-containing protein [Anaerolineales bacterium]|nr:trypsin-like peptidase domain-containing protein [Anaerolineales bacterium]
MNGTALLDSALDELLERIRPVLAVVQNGRRGAGAGVLAGDGLVITNLHVVGRARSLQVLLYDDTQYEAHVVATDPKVDLALLQIPQNGHAAAVFSSGNPRPGELVYAFGHPWGSRNVLTGGVLSAVTSLRTRKGLVPILRADVQLAPGNSGGPLLNAAGEVLGLNSMIFGGDQSVAIPASLIRSFLAGARTDKLPEAVL